MTAQIPIGTPGIVGHDVLGRLTVDVKQVRRSYDGCPEIDAFDGQINATLQADGTAVRINLTPEFAGLDPGDDLTSWVDRCTDRILRAIADLEAIKAHVADDHMPMKNDGWLQEGELPLSKAEFMGRLTLYAINFLDDEGMDLFFDDGGLFAGHSSVGGSSNALQRLAQDSREHVVLEN